MHLDNNIPIDKVIVVICDTNIYYYLRLFYCNNVQYPKLVKQCPEEYLLLKTTVIFSNASIKIRNDGLERAKTKYYVLYLCKILLHVELLQNYRDFLPCIKKIFSYTKWTGIPVYGGKIATAWALVLFVMLSCLEAAAIWKLIRLFTGVADISSAGRSLVARLSGSIFYANALISLILTWRFIGSWDNLSQHWLRNDLSSGLDVPSDKYITGKIVSVTTFVSVCAIVEHLFSMVAAIGYRCYSLEECFRTYILISHGFLLQHYEYDLWLAIPIFILSKLATVLWNLQDYIIILMSIGLISQYNMLNMYTRKLIKREYQKKQNYNTLSYLHIDQWRKLRRAYARQANLVRSLESHLGPLVLLSNLNNLYFICLQLYLGIRIMSSSWISRTYYLISLTWLLSRACGVVLAAAAIILYSKNALPHLRSCLSSTYNIEIKRLITQLTHDNVGLSGMKLFFLPRQSLLEYSYHSRLMFRWRHRLVSDPLGIHSQGGCLLKLVGAATGILDVVATVIKYELILLQYDK